MNITKKQKQEIDFLTKYFDADPSYDEVAEYINWTVHGDKAGDIRSNNSLYQAKRRLDIVIKDWRMDMVDGQLAYWELLEGFDNHPYAVKVVNTIRK